MRRWEGRLGSLLAFWMMVLLLEPGLATGAVILNSIKQITGGTTINCENVSGSNGPASQVLSPYGITPVWLLAPDYPAQYTTFVSWVTGNTAAPFANHALSGQLRLTP